MAPHLLIAGPMGVGKSTTASALADAMNLPLYLESAAERNPYLERFYADMRRWALPSQTFFICEALSQQQRIAEEGRGAVQDRSVWEHLGIFATSLYRGGHLTGADIALLEQIATLGLRNLPAPDLLIYLYGPQPAISERIRMRGRDYEQSVSKAYLTDHISAYDTWITGVDFCPVLEVDTTRFDPRRQRDINTLVDKINNRLEKIEEHPAPVE